MSGQKEGVSYGKQSNDGSQPSTGGFDHNGSGLGFDESNKQALWALSRYVSGISGKSSVSSQHTGVSNHVPGLLGDPATTDNSGGTNQQVSQEQEISLNDMNSIMQAVTEALRDQRAGQWRNPKYRSPVFSSLVDQMKDKLITLNSIILPPLVKSQLATVLAPIRAEALKVGDRYFELAMEDLDQGRVDRLDKLLWLSGINQVRLKLAKEAMFENVNAYVKEHYASDPADPDAYTFFLPSEDEPKLAETWKRVNDLISANMAMVRETITFNVGGQPHKLTIITIADKPIGQPDSLIGV